MEISDWLGLPQTDVLTEVYLFRDAAQKRALMGAGHTEIAKPWLNEVYIKSADPDNMVLRHELAHALAGALVHNPLSVPMRGGWMPNMPLIEGLATAIAWKPGIFTHHELTGVARELALTEPLESLLNPLGFFGVYGPLAYPQSASFVAWLRSTFGVDALQALYRGESVEKITGASFSSLEEKWRSTCLREAVDGLSGEARALAGELLGRKPAFKRPCGLELGWILRDAVRSARRGELPEALEVLKRLSARSGGNPRLRLSSITAARAALEPTVMAQIASELLEDPAVQAQPRLVARVASELADAMWWLGSASASMKVLDSVNPRILPSSVARSIWARRFLLARQGPGDARLLDYLSGRPGSEASMDVLLQQFITRPEDPMVQYLYAFRMERRGVYGEAADAFERVGAPSTFPPRLIREAAYRAGKLRIFQGRHDEALEDLALAASYEDFAGYGRAIERWQRIVRAIQRREK
jgi:hypothetical protein